MSTLDKPRYPREQALAVAQEIYYLLEPWCERCKVVGSLRRRKAQVSDVEFLFVGKTMTRKKDLFGNEDFDAGLHRIDELVDLKIIRPRPNIKGSIAWGEKNRLAMHVETGMPIDFFATTEECWANYLVCRTGGLINNTRIATAYQKQGMKWQPYSIGYLDRQGDRKPNNTEQAVYANCGLTYLPPDRRP